MSDLDELLLGWPEVQEFADQTGCSYERALVTMVNRGINWTITNGGGWEL